MPLLDHFHPPLSDRRHWEGFHSRWASAISDSLNELLPEQYFAEPTVHFGAHVEVDVAAFSDLQSGGNGVATLPRTMPKLAPADLVLDAVFPDARGVKVYESSGGARLVAAVELVSPGNKDRPDARRAFAAKCASYIQTGCGLIVVDTVTDHHSKPLDDLMALIAPEKPLPKTASLTAVSYRPLHIDKDVVELRIRDLAVGQALPQLTLALNAGTWVNVDLETTYEDACSRCRL